MPTTTPTERRVSLHAYVPNLRVSVRALPDTATGEMVVIDIGLSALMLDAESASDLAEALRLAVIELDRHAEAVSA